jgi:hypothetical protein
LCAFADFADHVSQFVTRIEEAEQQRRTDQEREAAFNEEPITLPPAEEPGDPTAQDADTHEPSGDLHTLAAKEEPPEPLVEDEELPSELPDEPPQTETDAEGGVPLSYGKVPTSYVHTEDQSEFALPEPMMTEDARRRRKLQGGVVQQPTAISLNEG